MFLYYVYYAEDNDAKLWNLMKGNDDVKNIKPWDLLRQASIFALTILQFFSLTKIKQTQKFDGRWYVERFDKDERREKCVYRYYTLNCMLIMYNALYLFIFKVQYFGGIFTKYITNDPQHVYVNIGYAFSFSLSSSILFLFSHLLASYGQWRQDQEEWPKIGRRSDRQFGTIVRFTDEEGRWQNNKALDMKMKKERKTEQMRNKRFDSTVTHC